MSLSQSIAALGRVLGPDVLAASQAMFCEEQFRLAEGSVPIATDIAYGEHQRQRLDLYAAANDLPAPVLLWVHGGGFIRGDKAAPESPFNAHIGRWAARNGLVGAVMNYRYAPGSQWPSGIEDVAAAVAWIEAEGASHGIDGPRIILAGTSAGAVHVAGYVARGARASIKGAILLSGLYGPREGIVGTTLPLFVASAEYDPPRFQCEYAGLIGARLERHGSLPVGGVIGGHNHFTLAMHIGTDDARLGEQLLAFLAATGCR